MKPVIIKKGQSPLILGMPHGGTHLPDNMFTRLNDNGKILADTDWHLDKLYQDLAPDVTVVKATFHRYIIDANRDPKGVSLYPGQNTTTLCPLIDFDNNNIWSEGEEPNLDEINQRLLDYHTPYHQALTDEIERVKTIHGYAILFDCHSIRSHIPFLFEGILPTFNIGTNMSQTCAVQIEKTTKDICQNARIYSSVINQRFKGGWTTRYYGQPQDNVHAIQMELAQSAYMQEQAPWNYNAEAADKIRPYLAKILKSLIEQDVQPHTKD